MPLCRRDLVLTTLKNIKKKQVDGSKADKSHAGTDIHD